MLSMYLTPRLRSVSNTLLRSYTILRAKPRRNALYVPFTSATLGEQHSATLGEQHSAPLLNCSSSEAETKCSVCTFHLGYAPKLLVERSRDEMLCMYLSPRLRSVNNTRLSSGCNTRLRSGCTSFTTDFVEIMISH